MSATPQQMLDCAKEICAIGEVETTYRATISRAYYAAYHAALEFHARLPVPGSVGAATGYHTQLMAQLSTPGIGKKNKKFFVSQALAKSLRPLVDARVDADYKLGVTINKELALSIVNQASEVVAQAAKYTGTD
ncbi:hypothetical protein ACQUFY_21635 [Robbsia andropogonis]|uniref:hypothetical protein n=1 Tax=Robbsia andropogonis TaxID=28092 RepID=UPI003D1F98ED